MKRTEESDSCGKLLEIRNNKNDLKAIDYLQTDLWYGQQPHGRRNCRGRCCRGRESKVRRTAAFQNFSGQIKAPDFIWNRVLFTFCQHFVNILSTKILDVDNHVDSLRPKKHPVNGHLLQTSSL